MREQIRQLSTFPTDVDEFVNQIQCLEYIEDNYQEVKDQVELNQQIFQICDKFDLVHRDDKSAKFINEIYQLINTLNQAIYDTKDKSDRRKEQMKKEILKKIPELNSRLEALHSKITDRKLLLIDGANVRSLLEDLNELDLQMGEVVTEKNNVQIYQKTLDMGRIEPFNNVGEAKVLLSYIMKLWTSIHAWQQNIEVW